MSHTRGMSRDPRGRGATQVGERFSGFPSRDACGAGEYGLQTSTRRGVDPPGSLAKPTIKFHNIRFATHIRLDLKNRLKAPTGFTYGSTSLRLLIVALVAHRACQAAM